MRRIVILSLLLCLGSIASADDKPAAPPERLSLNQTVERVIELVAAGDQAALKELALLDFPDPWTVVEKLRYKDAHDAALAFAKAGTRPATQGLAAYVEAYRDKSVHKKAWTVLATMQFAKNQQKPRVGLAAVPQPRVPANSVIGVLLSNLEGHLYRQLGDMHGAADAFIASGEGAANIGWHHWAGLSLSYAGRCLSATGLQEKALEYLNRAVEHWRTQGYRLGVAAGLLELGKLARKAQRHQEAIGYYERAIRIFDELDNPTHVARMLNELGLISARTGQYRRALEYYSRALDKWHDLGNQAEWAGVQINMGNVESDLGNYSKAIEHHRRGIAAARAARKQEYVGNGLLNLAGVYWEVGDIPRALSHTDQALEKLKDTGRADAIVNAMIGLGILRLDMGDTEGSAQMLESAIVQATVLGAKTLEALARSNLGRTRVAQREYAKAIDQYQAALIIQEELKDRVSAARARAGLAGAQLHAGETKEGMANLDQSIREARRLRLRRVLVTSLAQLAKQHLRAGSPEKAMFLAREAAHEVEYMLVGYAVDEAVHVRGRFSGLFAVGSVAAARAGATAEVVTFLESGRAGALLELLGGQHPLQWSDVPEEFRAMEIGAREREARARAAYRETAATGNLEKARIAARALDAAQERVRSVMDHIFEQASSRTRALLYPRAATLEEIQGSLEKGEALVLFGLGFGDALAVVLTTKTARVVELGKSEAIRDACVALDYAGPETDDTKTIAALRKLVIDPLGLPKDTKRVLVSPEGALCYAPFALLLDLPTVLAPSGTTLVHLRTRIQGPGSGVLALGDPAYEGVADTAKAVYARGGDETDERSGVLTRLVASGVEATAVGTTVLLRADASETGLRNALEKQERWRAVHFACHGLVDRKRPLLSSLALSSAQGEDGFLTAREILRLRIPADMAVLSACHTGQGKIAAGEGLVGLARAFMYAGAPRILCSLWKVDDEATQALMVKFYELWAPESGQGIPAATALKQAQAWVRAQKRWAHPYYWGAWVLWGLP